MTHAAATLPASPSFVVRAARWDADGEKLRHVRRTVFIDEQRVPEELEWDADDPVCEHVLVEDRDGNVIATGRLLGPTGTLINCAKAKQHREPNLAGAPPIISTTPACPPLRNTQQRMCPRGPPHVSRPNHALASRKVTAAKREIRSSP